MQTRQYSGSCAFPFQRVCVFRKELPTQQKMRKEREEMVAFRFYLSLLSRLALSTIANLNLF